MSYAKIANRQQGRKLVPPGHKETSLVGHDMNAPGTSLEMRFLYVCSTRHVQFDLALDRGFLFIPTDLK